MIFLRGSLARLGIRLIHTGRSTSSVPLLHNFLNAVGFFRADSVLSDVSFSVRRTRPPLDSESEKSPLRLIN